MRPVAWSWKGPYWEPRDLWLGVYWTTEDRKGIGGVIVLRFLSVYVCLLPCLPIRVRWHTYVDPEWQHHAEARED